MGQDEMGPLGRAPGDRGVSRLRVTECEFCPSQTQKADSSCLCCYPHSPLTSFSGPAMTWPMECEVAHCGTGLTRHRNARLSPGTVSRPGLSSRGGSLGAKAGVRVVWGGRPLEGKAASKCKKHAGRGPNAQQLPHRLGRS